MNALSGHPRSSGAVSVMVFMSEATLSTYTRLRDSGLGSGIVTQKFETGVARRCGVQNPNAVPFIRVTYYRGLKKTLILF